MSTRKKWTIGVLISAGMILVASAVIVCSAIRHYQSTLRLAKAVRENNPVQVRLQLAAGSDPNVPLYPHPLSLNTVLHLLFHAKRPESRQETLVLYATNNDDDPVLQSLLEAGGSVHERDEDGHTALWIAAVTQRHHKMRLLVQHGADVNDSHLLIALLTEVMFFEVTPDDITYLLAHGANPNDQDTSSGSMITPLTIAAASGNLQPMRDLLHAGADINQPALGIGTPLMLAAACGKPEAVVILLKAGANTTLRDKDGHTAEDLARTSGEKQIAQLIHNFHAPRTLR